MKKKTVVCDDCKKQVKQTLKCICGMYTCTDCTLSSRHDTTRGEHWEMLAKYHNIPLDDILSMMMKNRND